MTGVCRPETALVVAVDHNWVFDFTPMRRDEPFLVRIQNHLTIISYIVREVNVCHSNMNLLSLLWRGVATFANALSMS
jgi:hypothetical protein